MEDIPVTIVGIEQNSLINGPANRSSLTASLHESGGAKIVLLSLYVRYSSPVYVTHGQPIPTSLALIATASRHAVVSYLHAILLTAFMLQPILSILASYFCDRLNPLCSV